ncbi:Cse1-domain-containing protein [Dimargaris cristalligena]|uniref:Cse1-domain-containing protein n=1 Tax=Dimargaris cristalligena TaxID=215637 RepID=A0A4P9ZYK6_9FUNG|nr:Cse1-domain-containing protein [Dimargaris cristalligena]|eukprot:RKP38845.1 Cse1-domain-containing protein [Dimargaris cristalligena]
MAAQAPNLQVISECFQQTLQPATRKQAEQYLNSAQKSPGFIVLLLELAGTDTADPSTRFAASLYFKNFVKKYWDSAENDEVLISDADRSAVKAQIVDLMIRLPTKLQLQVSDGLSIIAKNDFPDQWPSLIQDLNNKLNPQDYHVNNGVLQTAHAIFKRWRKEFRTNELFSEIKFVLEQFTGPFTQIFKTTDELIEAHRNDAAALKTLLPTMLLLTKIYYSLNCQDLPEYFEDHMTEFMTVFHKYLLYTNPLVDNNDDDEATDVEKIKASICEIISLYTNRAEEPFAPILPKFVETVWNMLTQLGLQPKYDILASKAIGFLTTVVYQPGNRELFANQDTMKLICEKIILPNMTLRENDEELFEDEPLQYVVHDLEASDADTRRRAASDLVRAFLQVFPTEITAIVSTYIDHYLARYNQNPATNWKDKDVALFMVMAVAAVSVVARHGATKVNDQIDVVDFFSKHIMMHLQELPGQGHPIIQADAIKYVYIFRNQLTKEQHQVLLPLLCHLLSHPSPCVATYASICLERIFFIKRDKQPLFSPADIKPLIEPLFTVLFNSLEAAGSAEKMSEQEYTMKLIMRVIIVAREQIAVVGPVVLAKLAAMVGLVSKNPSNPQFNHYMFESIAVLARFTVAANPESVTAFEQTLFPPFQFILQADVADFTPYVFQILSQLLSAHAGQALPDPYKALFPPLLLPVLWENSGNVPALVRLIKSYLQVGPSFIAPDHLSPVLGIFQKLLASKTNDRYAFDLLNTLLYYAPMAALKPQLNAVFLLMLNRLQNSSTSKFTRAFIYFIAFFMCLEKPGESMPALFLNVTDGIQPKIFAGILRSIVIPNLKNLNNTHERKVTTVGFMRLLTTQPAVVFTTPYLEVLPDLLVADGGAADSAANQTQDGGDPSGTTDNLDSVDLIDSAAFQTNYSRLATISKEQLDPAPYVTDYRAQLKDNLVGLAQSQPVLMRTVVERLSPEAKAILGV